MPRIRIWTLESDNDAEAVKCLATKLSAHLQLADLSIRKASRKTLSAISRRRKGNRFSSDNLKLAVRNYLKEDDCVIFVIDTDSWVSLHQRRQEQNSLVNKVERILSDNCFTGKVFFAPAVQELEAWLLIDCLGIFCYFASKSPKYRTIDRDRLVKDQTFRNLIKDGQKGDTELIVETVAGGNGPKEYLEDFSKKVLRALNPNIPPKNINRERYDENMAPALAEHIVIDKQTLARNNSLCELGNILAQFK